MAPRQDVPIACTLGPDDLRGRIEWIRDLTRDALEDHERDGLILRLRYSARASEGVREMVRRERACCGFLDFQLEEDAEGVRLTITAPEAARSAVDMLFATFVPAP